MTFQSFETTAHRFFKLTALFRNEEKCFNQGTNPRKIRTFGNNTSGEMRLLARNKLWKHENLQCNMNCVYDRLAQALVSHSIVYYPNAHDIADVPIKC